MNLELLVEALYQLSNAPNEAASALVLQQFPCLTETESDVQLTRVIGEQYRQNNMPNVCLFTAVRGFLRRYRANKNLSVPAWSLAAHSPLAHLLALTETDDLGKQLKWSRLALPDLDAQTEPELYGMAQYRLGLSFLLQTEAGDMAAFEPAMTHLATAVQVLDPLLDENSRSLNGRAHHNLAKLHLTWPGANRRSNVEQALTLLEKAQTLLEKATPEIINVLILQGDAYLDRIQGERLHNIERGIDYYKQAQNTAQQAQAHSRLHEILHNLAVAYRLRLNGRRTDNYETALAYAQRALQHVNRATMAEAWAKTTAEQAVIYAHRQMGNRSDNLEQAIDLARQALDFYQFDAHPYQWSLVHLTLGNLFCDRLEGNTAENYEQAIAHFETVKNARDLVTNPIGWAEAVNNLGTAYAGLSQRPYDANYRQAMDCFQQALAVHGPDKLPDRARRTAVNQGNLAFHFRQWSEALQAFQTALDAGERLFQASGTPAGRQAELAENAGLAAKAAYCRLQLDPPQPHQAFQQLEQGKTRLLTEALALKDADLEKLPESAKQAVQTLRQTIHELEAEMRLPPHTPARRDDIELGNELVQTRQALHNLIINIRQTHPNFLKTGPSETDLTSLIPANGAVVAPLITAQGSVAFVIPHGTQTIQSEHIIPLPKFTGDDLNRLLVGTADDPGWVMAYLKRSETPGSWITAVTHFTEKLWPTFIQPIAQKLIDFKCKKAILIPQGGLQMLPLHAAWYQENGHRHYFIDDFEISYTPSLSVLASAQKRLNNHKGAQALIAGINNYQPPRELKNAVFEAEQIAETFRAEPLLNEKATRQTILEKVRGKNYLHLACHGSFNWEDALESALYLANDEPLSLNDIMTKLDLETLRLVTLSACETGITEFSQLPDEFIGLPAGFMQAGSPGVVSSLWTVDDNSTSILMERFYAFLLEDRLPPAAALKAAQARLRRFNPLYENPYFWAAFTFYGA